MQEREYCFGVKGEHIMKNSVSVNVKLDVQDLRKHLIEERYDNIPNKIGFYGWWIIIGVLGMLF